MTRIAKALVAVAVLAGVLLSAAAAVADTLDRALTLAAEGRYPEARRVLDPLLDNEPGNAQLRLLHGVLRVQEGHRGEAIAVFSGLAREFPDMFEAHNNLAVLYVDEGRLEEARAVLTAILERRPEAVGYRNLGEVYEKLARRAYAQSRALRDDRFRDGDDDGDSGTEVLQASDAAGTVSEPATALEPASGSEPPAVPERPAPAEEAVAAACLATGEFLDMGTVEEARLWLAALGAEATRVSSGTRERVKDYRVYLPPFESRKAADAALGDLREKGVSDIAVIPKGARKNAVSLGIYAKEANASRRVARLEELGYAPVVEPNSMAVEEHATIEARLPGGFEDLRDAWASSFPDHAVRQVECD